jgi:hypothetical protein
MTRLILVSAGGLLLATASTPPPTASNAYPTCSAKVTDRCVQRHERGRHTAPRAATPARAGGESELSSVVAAEAPAPAPAGTAYAAPRPAPRPAARPATAHRRGYQLALRSGERG